MINRNLSIRFTIALIFSWQGSAFAAPPVDLNSKVASGATAYSGPPPSSNTVHQYPPGTALQKKSQLENEYFAKTKQLETKYENATGTGIEVTSERTFSGHGQTVAPSYKVFTPDGTVIDVSSTRQGNGEVDKTIAVYAPDTSVSAEAVVIEVPHADAKAAIAYKDGQGINPENAEAAKNVSVQRDNIAPTTESLPYTVY